MPTNWGTSSFSIHQPNIIEIVLDGSFGLEGTKDYADEMTRQVRAFNGKPIKMLSDISKWEGSTPEAFQYFDTFTSWLNQQNVVLAAYVSSSKFKFDMLTQFSDNLFRGHYQLFDNREDALDWLKVTEHFDASANPVNFEFRNIAN